MLHASPQTFFCRKEMSVCWLVNQLGDQYLTTLFGASDVGCLYRKQCRNQIKFDLINCLRVTSKKSIFVGSGTVRFNFTNLIYIILHYTQWK